MVKELICTDDINVYQTGSHIRHRMKIYSWKTQIEQTSSEIAEFINMKTRTCKELSLGVELVEGFMKENFKDNVAGGMQRD